MMTATNSIDLAATALDLEIARTERAMNTADAINGAVIEAAGLLFSRSTCRDTAFGDIRVITTLVDAPSNTSIAAAITTVLVITPAGELVPTATGFNAPPQHRAAVRAALAVFAPHLARHPLDP